MMAAALAAAVLFMGLAFLVRWVPRAGGWVLLGLCCLAFGFALKNMTDARVAWGQVSIVLQAFLVLGVTGIALVRDATS
jgi:hypothetical protein